MKLTMLMSLAAGTVFVLTVAAMAVEWDSASRAEKIYDGAMRYVSRFDKATGELFCWHARGGGSQLLSGYKAYGQSVWLDYALKYLDQLDRRMAVGPDGYRGFIGPFIYDNDYWTDVHIGDSILCNLMLDFAEIVHDDPALQPRYGEKAAYFTELVAKNLIEKWDARGTWHQDGPIGGYVGWDHYGKPGEFTGWEKVSLDKLPRSGWSIPFNKSMDLAVACLKLYRLTGKSFYRDRAEKVFNWHRLRMQNYNDCMLWNYWEPLGPFDLVGDENRTVHWMATHPYRNYQAGEVGDVVEAYHMGLVYTEADIRRIINTNLKIMWNGEMDSPSYANSIVTLPGYRPAKPSEHYPTWAGTLWASLAGFDPTIRKLYAERLAKVDPTDDDVSDDIALAYFNKVTCAEAPSFTRRYAPDAKVDQRPAPVSGGQTVACALPMTFKVGQTTTLLGKIPADGNVRVDLYDQAGARKLATLFNGEIVGDPDGMKGVFRIEWDGGVNGRIAPGKYTVSWFYNNGRRDYPVNILEADSSPE